MLHMSLPRRSKVASSLRKVAARVRFTLRCEMSHEDHDWTTRANDGGHCLGTTP